MFCLACGSSSNEHAHAETRSNHVEEYIEIEQKLSSPTDPWPTPSVKNLIGASPKPSAKVTIRTQLPSSTRFMTIFTPR
jgi:hypothetical protein